MSSTTVSVMTFITVTIFAVAMSIILCAPADLRWMWEAKAVMMASGFVLAFLTDPKTVLGVIVQTLPRPIDIHHAELVIRTPSDSKVGGPGSSDSTEQPHGAA